MHSIQIQSSGCLRCGRCVAVCPCYLFRQESSSSSTTLSPKSEDHCVGCLHCAAMCPAGVITVDGKNHEHCVPVSTATIPSFEQIATLATMRRSIRCYQPQPVDKDTLSQLMNVLRWSPTARNGLPVKWVIVNRRDLVIELLEMVIDWMKTQPECVPIVRAWENGVDIVGRGAPCIALAYTDETALWPVMDATIAATTLDLCAAAQKLGSCWAGFFVRAAQHFRPIPQKLGLTDTQTIQAGLLLGYPDKEVYTRIPWRPELDIRWMD